MSKEEFDKLLLEAINDKLASIGESIKQEMIYSVLRKVSTLSGKRFLIKLQIFSMIEKIL